MKKFFGFIVLAVIMIALNPSFDKHVKTIDQEYDRKNEISGIIIGPAIIKRVVKYENKYIFSYTTFNGEIVSIGAFGGVGVRNLDIKFDTN